MILRARADGVVVKRDVVPGNYYDSKDTLLTIAPLDHLWVRGGVSELDADKVEVGQKLTVIFPFSHREIESKIDYIDKAIDPDTRSAKFRATIPNPGGKVKAGAFVKVQVHVPPEPGRTVIPRSAMVSVDRTDYVFIRKPGKVATFERRPIIAATESNDIVVVAEPAEGHRELAPGEQVVTLGQPDPRADVRGQAHGRGRPPGLGPGPREGRSNPPERRRVPHQSLIGPTMPTSGRASGLLERQGVRTPTWLLSRPTGPSHPTSTPPPTTRLCRSGGIRRFYQSRRNSRFALSIADWR